MEANEYIQKVLKESPFRQAQLAECLGVDQSTISHWTKGVRPITSVQFEKALGVLGYSLLDYMNGTVRTLSLSFSATGLEEKDIVALGWVNNVFANLCYMETLASNDSSN